jgi:hypothetical protein
MISRRLLEMTHCLKRGARPGLTRWHLGHGFAVGAGQDKEITGAFQPRTRELLVSWRYIVRQLPANR